MSTHTAFWIRYGLIYGRLLAQAGFTPNILEDAARALESSWRPSQHLAARAMRRGYWRQIARGF